MHGFTTITVDLGAPPAAAFQQLLAAVRFEAVAPGRHGLHLTRPGPRGVPIVRTTTRYRHSSQPFAPVHEALIQRIHAAAPTCRSPFNHALTELYEPQYRKMGYHSDQALDLDPESWIAVVSCYERDIASGAPGLRQLMVKSKNTADRFTLPMAHGSVVLFSVATNARFSHKIVLPSPSPNAPRWIGLTLRCSKTFLNWRDGVAQFADGTPLTLADETQRRTFFQMRGAENRDSNFVYPPVPFTLSEGDLLPPI